MNRKLDTRLDELADLLADRMFDKLVAKLTTGEIELPLPPSDGAPARRPRAPAPAKPKALPPAPAPAPAKLPPAGTKAALMVDAVLKVMTHEDPGNAGMRAKRLHELLVAKQKLSPPQAKARIRRAKDAGAIRLEGRTLKATYFRT